MTITHDPNEQPLTSKKVSRAALLVVALTSFSIMAISTTADASQTSAKVTVEIVDEHGNPRVGATAIACPNVADAGGERDYDCLHPTAGGETNNKGRVDMVLTNDTTYSILAFVLNPEPAWACPGWPGDGSANFYFGSTDDIIEGSINQIDRKITVAIVEPSAADCPAPPPEAVLTVVDQNDNPIAGAVFQVDGFQSFSSITDDNGVALLPVDPDTTYTLSPFVADWKEADGSPVPCPSFTFEGVTYHMGEEKTLTGADLLLGVTFVLNHPSEAC